MREGVEIPRRQLSRRALIIRTAVVIVALLLLREVAGGGGAITVLIIIVVLRVGRLLVRLRRGDAPPPHRLTRALARAIGELVAWRGITGRLARENAIRQPGRTLVTAMALTIGIALVTFVAVLAAGTKATINQAVSRSFAGNLIIESSQSGGEKTGIPAGLAVAARRVPGVAAVTPIAFTVGRLHGSSSNTTVTAIEPSTFGQLYRIEWKKGSNATLAELDTSGALVSKEFAKSHHLKVGDTFSLQTPTDRRVTLTVKGIVQDNSRLLAGVTIPLTLAREAFGQRDDAIAFLGYAPGVTNEQVQPVVNRLLAIFYPQAKSLTAAQFKEEQAKQINTLLTLIYVLLALSVIVSLFGIVNTLILSIYERTRELGMLRAIGTSRRQIRQMIRYESVITSTIGGVFGLVIGTVGALLVTTFALSESGFVNSVPVGTLLVLLVVSALAGVVAAQLPARRAARLDVLGALSSE
jgi:putative ABC transport system permease protein